MRTPNQPWKQIDGVGDAHLVDGDTTECGIPVGGSTLYDDPREDKRCGRCAFLGVWPRATVEWLARIEAANNPHPPTDPRQYVAWCRNERHMIRIRDALDGQVIVGG